MKPGKTLSAIQMSAVKSWVGKLENSRKSSTAFKHLQNALQNLHIGHHIPLDNKECKLLLDLAAEKAGISDEDRELAYTAIGDILVRPDITEEQPEGYTPEQQRIWAVLGPYVNRPVGANGKPPPIPFTEVIKKLRPGIEVYRDEKTSHTRFDKILEKNQETFKRTEINPSELKEYIVEVIKMSGEYSDSTLNRYMTDTYKILRETLRPSYRDKYGNLQYKTVEDLDKCKTLVQDAAGDAICLLTCKAGKHREDAPMIKKLAVAYDPWAKCPTWEKSFHFMMGGASAKTDEEKARVEDKKRAVKQALGVSALWKDNPMRRAYYLHGRTRTAKTTMLDAVAKTVGRDFARSINSEKFIEKKNGHRVDPITAIVAMDGMNMINFSDLGSKGTLNGPQLKSITGETEMEARNLHHDSKTMTRTFTCWLQSNSKLPPGDDVVGLEDRLRLINMMESVTDDMRDENIMDKFVEEGSGILNWLLEGLKDYIDNGEFMPQFILDDTMDYLNMNSPVVRAYIMDRVIQTGNDADKMTVSNLYADYKIWRKAVGKDPIDDDKTSKYLHSLEQFRMHLDRNFIKIEQKSTINGRVYYALGVKLTDEVLLNPADAAKNTPSAFEPEPEGMGASAGDQDF